jgi:outer membrane protein assembly factor BamE (lipoprotein component of BamABCDE complex)
MKTVSATLIAFAALAPLAAGALTACTPTKATRGNIVEEYRMAEIVPGVSSRTNVLQSLGSPTTMAPFDENIWYYIGQKTEKTGIFDPKVVDKKVVVVAFNDEGLVDTIEEVDAQMIDVPHVRRKTPTSGNDITVMEQLLGNVGRFNKNEDSNAASTAGGASGNR